MLNKIKTWIANYQLRRLMKKNFLKRAVDIEINTLVMQHVKKRIDNLLITETCEEIQKTINFLKSYPDDEDCKEQLKRLEKFQSYPQEKILKIIKSVV